MADKYSEILIINALNSKVIKKCTLGSENRISTENPFVTVCIKTNKTISVELNNEKSTFQPFNRSVFIPCVFDPETYVFRLVADDTRVEIEYSLRNQFFNLNLVYSAYSDFCKSIDENVSSDDLHEFLDIVENKASFSATEVTPDTVVGTDLYEEMKSVTREDIRAIMSKPAHQLSAGEYTERIERAQRINSYSIRHLASHSELWIAKRISGVYPGKIMAQVFEDNINIYENVFVRMLIDKMYERLYDDSIKRAVKRYNEREIELIKESSELVFANWKLQSIFESLVKPFLSDDEKVGKNTEEKTEKLEEDLIESTIKLLAESKEKEFYYLLSKESNLPLPIMLTNILTRDEHYNKSYKLWQRILGEKEPEYSEKSINGVCNDSIVHYLRYIESIFAWSIKKSLYESNAFCIGRFDIQTKRVSMTADFEEIRVILQPDNRFNGYPCTRVTYSRIQKNTVAIAKQYHHMAELLQADYPQIFSYDPKKSLISINGNLDDTSVSEIVDRLRKLSKTNEDLVRQIENHLYTLPDDAVKTLIIPCLTNPPFDERTFCSWIHERLDEISRYCNTSEISGALLVYPFASIDLDSIDYAGTIKPPIITNDSSLQCAINYGNSYGDDKTANKYGSYRFGILPISRKEPMAPYRIVKYLQMQINRLTIEWETSPKRCPSCGKNTVAYDSNGDPYCNDKQRCGAIWNMRECPNCHRKHPWIGLNRSMKKRIDDKWMMAASRASTIQIMTNKEILLDNTMICDFQYPNKYRCPKCGYIE